MIVIGFNALYPKLGISINIHRTECSILFHYLFFIGILSQPNILSKLQTSSFFKTLNVPKFMLPFFQNLTPLNKGVDGDFEYIVQNYLEIHSILKTFLSNDKLASLLQRLGLTGSVNLDRMIYLILEPLKQISEADNDEQICNIICRYFLQFEYLYNKTLPRISIESIFNLSFVQNQNSRPFGSRNFRRVGDNNKNTVSIGRSDGSETSIGSFVTFLIYQDKVSVSYNGIVVDATNHVPIPSETLIITPNVDSMYCIGLLSTLITSQNINTHPSADRHNKDVNTRGVTTPKLDADANVRKYSTLRELKVNNTNLYVYKEDLGLIFFESIYDWLHYRTKFNKNNVNLKKGI